MSFFEHVSRLIDLDSIISAVANDLEHVSQETDQKGKEIWAMLPAGDAANHCTEALAFVKENPALTVSVAVTGVAAGLAIVPAVIVSPTLSLLGFGAAGVGKGISSYRLILLPSTRYNFLSVR